MSVRLSVYLSRDDYDTEQEFVAAILQWRAKGYKVWTAQLGWSE